MSVIYHRWPQPTPPTYGGIQTLGPGVLTQPALVETIEDNEVNTSTSYGRRENPVAHTWSALRASYPPPLVVGFPNWWKTNYMFRVGVANHKKPVGLSLPTLDSIGESTMAARAYRAMQPQVNDGMSLVNFILELKDFRRMFQKWIPPLRALRPLLKLPIATDYSARAMARYISNVHLNIQFGWKPFISDIIRMLDILDLVRRRLTYLERNANKVVRRHYKADIPFTLPGLTSVDKWMESSVPSFSPTLTYKFKEIREERFVYSPRYHATMVFRYQIPESSPFRRKIDAFRAALGVKLDPAILWNAIPFSFIWDWFFDVGEFLRNFSESDLGIKTEVIDFSHSLKWHYLHQLSISTQDVSLNWSPAYNSAQYEESYYVRRRYIPNPYIVATETPSLMQASLGGALIMSAKASRRLPSPLR